MTVCNYFLEGRCRYGDKCWNEHPRGGRNQTNRGGGGSVNRVWVNPSQRSGGGVVQPSPFSRGGGDWGRGGSGTGRDDQSPNFNLNSQNRYSLLNNTQSGLGRTGGGGDDDISQQLEAIQKDMEVWQSSGQWIFSCYSVLKACITGFVELSPEELRMEYYTSRATGNVESYLNSVQQLANQWRSRVQELRTMNANTRTAMIAELSNPRAQTSSGGGIFSSSSTSAGFGSSSASSGFGSSSASSGFGSSSTSSGFGSSSTSSGFGSSSSSGFGSSSTSSSGFGSSSTSSGFVSSTASSGFGSSSSSGFAPSSSSGFRVGGFGSGAQGSAAGFSFSASSPGFGSATSQPASSQFGSSAPSASTFSFADPAGATASKSSAAGFSFTSASAGGSGGSSTAPGTGGFGGFGGGPSLSGSTEDRKSGVDNLYTPQSELTPDELREFTAERFTLGQIPLRPPPAELLNV